MSLRIPNSYLFLLHKLPWKLLPLTSKLLRILTPIPLTNLKHECFARCLTYKVTHTEPSLSAESLYTSPSHILTISHQSKSFDSSPPQFKTLSILPITHQIHFEAFLHHPSFYNLPVSWLQDSNPLINVKFSSLTCLYIIDIFSFITQSSKPR